MCLLHCFVLQFHWHMAFISRTCLTQRKSPGMWCLWTWATLASRCLCVLSTKASWRYMPLSLTHLYMQRRNTKWIFIIKIVFSCFKKNLFSISVCNIFCIIPCAITSRMCFNCVRKRMPYVVLYSFSVLDIHLFIHSWSFILLHWEFRLSILLYNDNKDTHSFLVSESPCPPWTRNPPKT